jgi:hypothetical protein
MAKAVLPASLPKCATCDRWSGARERTADEEQVEFDAAETNGFCGGGPWDGSVRDPLSRCGRWIKWGAES